MFVRDINGGTFNSIFQSRRNCSCSDYIDIYEGEVNDPVVGGPNHVYTIEKPCCPLGQVFGPNCCCKEVQFPVHTGDGGEGSQTVARIANLFPGLNCELPSPPHSLGGPDPLQTQPGVCRENVRRLLFSSCSTKFLPQLGTAELLCSRIHVSNPDPISEFALYHY